jgi:hypothetical protein
VVMALSAFIIWALCVVRKDGTAGLFD